MLLSDCCTAPPAGGMEEYGICGECKEHCEFLDDEISNYCSHCSHCKKQEAEQERRRLAEVEAGIPFEFQKKQEDK